MKILFSPSEDKKTGGILRDFSQNDFTFKNDKRFEIFKIYKDFVLQNDNEKLKNFFGLNKIYDIEILKENVLNLRFQKSILRYNGVAYKSLDYETLDKNSQNFIDKNVLIFSNLFGPILACDFVPFYKIKQGENLPNLDIAKFYKINFCEILDNFLDDEILDLRALFYEKFYDIKKPFYTLKFVKKGKVVSHWAKFYRGFVLRKIAQNKTFCIKEFLSLKIENLNVLEISKQSYKNEIIFEIL